MRSLRKAWLNAHHVSWVVIGQVDSRSIEWTSVSRSCREIISQCDQTGQPVRTRMSCYCLISSIDSRLIRAMRSPTLYNSRMSAEILSTKLYIPHSRPDLVRRSHLIDHLNLGLHGKLALVSAPAGFGKTTLVTEWLASIERPAVWLSLDENDSDPVRFLTYIVSAFQTLAPQVGTGILNLLESPQPPSIDSLLPTLLNDLTTISDDFVLVLDDYHSLDSQEIDAALAFLIDKQPPQMYLVIITRADPRLPLARLRARGQLTELRAVDLRFTADEAAEFLNQAMGLSLSVEDVAALETRTEGWIAGLQLAALSLKGQQNTHQFIQSFTGSHHFVLDYLIDEVLNDQPPHVHDFLLKTSILDRICAPLCDAVLQDSEHTAADMLEYIRQANLFLVPLDNERRWYRYHHLFGDLLRKQLGQSGDIEVNDLHIRASTWYEANGLDVEAFQHATEANDIDRAIRLIEAQDTPLYLRGFAHLVLNWLKWLPIDTLDSRPILWVMYGWLLWITHQSPQVESKLQHAANTAKVLPPGIETNTILGRVAAMRAMLAANEYQTGVMIAQAELALELLPEGQDYVQLEVKRTLASAHHIRGNRPEAIQAYKETIAICEATNNVFTNILATTGLGIVHAMDMRLGLAESDFHRVLELVSQPVQPIACEASLGLARLHYEWNDLDKAEHFCEQAIHLGQKIDGIDTAAAGQVLLAWLMLARGNAPAADRALAEVAKIARQRQFIIQIPRIAALQIRICLQHNDLETAYSLLQEHELPLSQARIALSQGKTTEALAVLTTYHQQMEEKSWRDEILKTMVLQAVANYQSRDTQAGITAISEALELSEPERCIRIFLDEGEPMMKLLSDALARGIMPEFVRRIMTAFHTQHKSPQTRSMQPLVEPLSERELEILALIAEGLSNREVGERLYLALSTVKGHNRNIFDKLQVKRRTEAVARARELGLI